MISGRDPEGQTDDGEFVLMGDAAYSHARATGIPRGRAKSSSRAR